MWYKFDQVCLHCVRPNHRQVDDGFWIWQPEILVNLIHIRRAFHLACCIWNTPLWPRILVDKIQHHWLLRGHGLVQFLAWPWYRYFRNFLVLQRWTRSHITSFWKYLSSDISNKRVSMLSSRYSWIGDKSEEKSTRIVLWSCRGWWQHVVLGCFWMRHWRFSYLTVFCLFY